MSTTEKIKNALIALSAHGHVSLQNYGSVVDVTLNGEYFGLWCCEKARAVEHHRTRNLRGRRRKL